MRVVAIDWSGRAKGAHRYIWLAEASGAELVRLECGRNREEIGDWLVAEQAMGERMVVGLDFAFSMPAWFLEERELASGAELWSCATTAGEDWLRECHPPFWGRPGKKKLGDEPWLRATDASSLNGAVGAKSVFQIGGAGAVGTGSVRGMPVLARLKAAGWAIWPFDPAGSHTVIEIYPRLLTGPVNKSNAIDRAGFIATHYPSLGAPWVDDIAKSEDAFDAAVSALVMAKHCAALERLPLRNDPQVLMEGEIWRP
jgi:hypothetical protein